MKMSIKDEVWITLGEEIDDSVEAGLGTSIVSDKSTDQQVYGFALTSMHLGFDPTKPLEQRYGQERALQIMDEIEASVELEEELRRNILYIACVWAASAKKTVEHLGPKPKQHVERLIDEIAKLCVRYWTLEPIVNQSGFQEKLGISQPRASKYLAYLEQQKVLEKTKKGGMTGGKKTSNVYKIIGTQDYSPEQIKEAFDALHLQSVTAEDQIKEYVSVGSTRKEATPDNPRGYTW